ncbi:MAG: hypothetical protein ACJ73D_01890 [Pyrinomonadaceae bacterium]
MARVFSLKAVVTSLAAVLILTASIAAQSRDQEFPSPVTQSEISSTIRARDIGDARLTTHYWVFDGAQGDIFIDVVTQNFSGDINVYQASDLKPLTQMVMFADNGVSETGRVIYMRQPGRLMLRVQGRSPNDDPASYKIKFAGSFVALAPQEEQKPPTVEGIEETGIKVNSVGTIVPVTPKATPNRARNSENSSSVPENPPARRADNEEQPEIPQKATPSKSDSGVNTILGNKPGKGATAKTSRSDPNPPAKRPQPAPARSRPEPVADPLAGVSLVITLKDGSRSERPMSGIIRFVYDHGFLTIFTKDGNIHRIAVTDLASVTVQ